MTDSLPKAVVFDLDGLLFNTEELYELVGTEVLRRRGKPLEAELIDAIMGRPGPIALQIMIDWHRLDVTVDQLAVESEGVFAGLLDDRLALMPGVLALLDRLEAAGRPKAIATSSGRKFAANVLGRFDLEPRFEFILTGEDIEHGKPAPDVYLKAAGLLDVPPGKMMVLEDSANGCAAAVAAGAFTVAVPGGHSLRHDFTGAAIVADSLADPAIYQALGFSPPTAGG